MELSQNRKGVAIVVQILATADNHLDFSAALFGPKRYERKEDFQRCFLAAMEYARKNKPDIVLIGGDLFDTINPRNPPRSLLMKTFRSLHEQGVRVFAISGHHDTPKSLEEGSSPLTVYGESGYVTFCSSYAQPTTVPFASRDGENVSLTAVSYNPFAVSNVDPLGTMKLAPAADINILLFHYPISGFRGYFPNEPVVQLSTIPKSFQLVVAGHLHAYQQLESRGTSLICPGSTERTAFSEETEQKGFVWIELTKDGLASKPEFISTPARRLQTIEFPIPETGDLTSLLKSDMETRTDRELVLRLKLKGKVTPELLGTYRRPVLQTFGAANFFHVLLDEDWELQQDKPLDALPRTTPLQELERYFEGQIAEATSERKKELREAFETAKDILKEFGAW